VKRFNDLLMLQIWTEFGVFWVKELKFVIWGRSFKLVCNYILQLEEDTKSNSSALWGLPQIFYDYSFFLNFGSGTLLNVSLQIISGCPCSDVVGILQVRHLCCHLDFVWFLAYYLHLDELGVNPKTNVVDFADGRWPFLGHYRHNSSSLSSCYPSLLTTGSSHLSNNVFNFGFIWPRTLFVY